MPKISMDKKYKTRDGRSVRVLCIDSGLPDYPVIAIVDGWDIHSYTAEGMLHSEGESSIYDLFEDTPYADFKIDEPVMVRVFPFDNWYPRHFAGVDSDGFPAVWRDGQTSYTTKAMARCDECRRPTEQELKGS